MKINKIILSLLSSALILHATGYARYKAAPLRKIYQHIDITKQESISFDYRVLNSNDCKKYFNAGTITKKGYQPIQVTFTNNSKYSIAISPASFSFRCAHAQDVAMNLHRNSIARGVGFGLGALIFTPLIIPALTQSLGAAQYNEDMDIDFEKKSFKNQVVPPYTTVDGVVFAECGQFSRDFTLTVKDIQKKDSLILSSRKYQLLL